MMTSLRTGLLASWRAVLGASLLIACGSTTEPQPREQLGVISFYGDPVVIDVPDTVAAGVPFEVSVRTYGGGCISKARTDVRMEGDTVHVRPFDRHSGHDVCTDILHMFDHRAQVTLDAAGAFEFVFHGRAEPGDAAVSFHRTVIVE